MMLRSICVVLTMLAFGGWAGSASSEQGGGRGGGSGPVQVDGTNAGGRVDLTRDWLFMAGDDPGYAGVALDDRGWKRISTEDELLTYGLRDFPFCWYRVHVRVRPGVRDLAVAVEGVSGQYEVFVNGVRVGAAGEMGDHGARLQPEMVRYEVPEDVVARANGELVVALRFSVTSTGAKGRGTDTPVAPQGPWGYGVYLVSQEAFGRDASFEAAHDVGMDVGVGALSLMVGFVSFALFLALRRQEEYLAIAVFLLMEALVSGMDISGQFRALSEGFFWSTAVFTAVGNVALIEVVRLVLGQRRTRLLAGVEVASALGALMQPLGATGAVPIHVAFAGFFVPLLIADVLLPVLLVRGWMRGNVDARLLLPAVVMLGFGDYYRFFSNVGYYAKLSGEPSEPSLHLGSYRLSTTYLGLFAFLITMLLFLVLRTVRIAQERARVAGELDAARTMQRLLLAGASRRTPGFDVESVYHPASEVGGDFFLVSPGEDGSLTAIVGDVSGKGLTAAMRVSMILGALRREESHEPGTILRGLNEALLTHGDLGFTTACCVRLERGGRFTVANAGHMAPYVGGVEVASVGALPLGLVGGETYTATEGYLPSGKRMVLLSDGVVEARSASGELYGFERLGALTLMPARDIADVAQRFGQEDDITVLTIACAVG